MGGIIVVNDVETTVNNRIFIDPYRYNGSTTAAYIDFIAAFGGRRDYISAAGVPGCSIAAAT